MSLITYVTRIHFADRVVEEALAEELARLGIRRPLVVSDAGEGEDLDRLLAVLPDRMAPVFVADPARGAGLAETARSCARDAGCDAFLALGGGTALDCARLAGAAGDGPGWSVVAIPTLPGQGMGLGPVTRPLPGPRPGHVEAPPRSLDGARLVPALVLCDPTLGGDVPADRLAASGFDALTHCIEAWLATGWNPPADGIALEGVRRATLSLVRAVEAPRDIAARRELLAAGLNAGLAAPKGLGAVHALAHALEARPRPGPAGPEPRHGWLHAALLPHVLDFNLPAVPERMEVLARSMGLGPGQSLPEALARLGARVGLPGTLAGLGLAPSALGPIARCAEADPANRTNPRLAVAADHRRLLAAAGAKG